MIKYLGGAIVLILLSAVSLWASAREGYIDVAGIAVAPPPLNHAVVFKSEVPQENADAIKKNIAYDQGVLHEDPTKSNVWLDLGLAYKQAGDIRASIRVWKYMNSAFPAQHTSAFNLGVVYQQNLQNYPQAEKYYREALRRDPKGAMNYLGLFELYKSAYKADTTAAVDILVIGMQEVPDDANMPIALAAYYRDDKKDYARSIQYIQMAVDVLKRTEGDTKKIQALEGEAERLGKL